VSINKVVGDFYLGVYCIILNLYCAVLLLTCSKGFWW